jgi:uncharacterized delta-60 repeat protein
VCPRTRADALRSPAFYAAILAYCSFAISAPPVRGAPAGSFDRTFSGDGKKLTNVFDRDDRAYDVEVQPDGRILIAGETRRPDRNPRMTLARYRRDGSLAGGFGRGGLAFARRFNGVSSESRGTAMALQSNGKVVVAGNDSPALALARFRRNGELDRRFGRRGTVVTELFGLNRAEDVAIQPNGKIVIAGHEHPAGSGEFELLLARYKRNGTLDRRFGDGGSLRTTFGLDTYAKAHGLALQPDGKIVVSGELGNGFIVARFHRDGSLDTSFGNNGGFQDLEPFAAGSAYDVAVLPDSRILAAGAVAQSGGGTFGLARYLPDGSPDPAFGEDGGVRTEFGHPRNSDGARALAVQPDGKIVVAGDSARQFSRSRFAVARYLPGGDLDPSFADGGKVRFGFPSVETERHRNFADAVALTPKGRIVVGGWSATLDRRVNGDDDFAIARLLGASG